MRLLQVTAQVECRDEFFDKAKEWFSWNMAALLVDCPTGANGGKIPAATETTVVAVGLAVEELDPMAGEFAGVYPVGTLDEAQALAMARAPSMVPTPRGPMPDATDDALRETRQDHPETCEHGVVLGEDCEGCGGKAVGSAVEQMSQRSGLSVEDGGANGDD
ncbi:MAG: hypothetical protein GY906_22905 [bacterium]|nr:hypothetical protein [bacterium]